jgi:predicted RNase H-like HicB family nuclease
MVEWIQSRRALIGIRAEPVTSHRGSADLHSDVCSLFAVIVSFVTDRLRLTLSFDEPDEEGWIVARVVEVPGAISQGRTREEARANVIDALRVMLTPDDGEGGGATESVELVFAE